MQTLPALILLRSLLTLLVLTGLAGAAPRVPDQQGRVPDEIERALANLSAEQAAERWGAERWLAAHLTVNHLPLLAETALAGGSEVQVRLVRALSSDARHMGVNVLLLTDARREVAELGRRALEELLLSWSESALDVSSGEGRLPFTANPGTRAYLLDPARGGLDSALGRLDRWGQGPMPLILDPSLDPGVAGEVERQTPRVGTRRDPRQPVHGTWMQGLRGVLNAHRVAVSVVGWRGNGQSSSEGTEPFALIHKKRRPPAAASEHVLDWCRGVLRPHDRAWNVASARALAALGWPAGLAWLEERWLEGDEAALEGLLVAARRGRVAPSLLDADRLVGAILGIQGLPIREAANRRFIEDLACALADLPLPSDQRARLTESLLQSSEPLNSAGRWVRLVVWEGQRPTDERVRELCTLWFESATTPPMQWQALRTLGALGVGLAAVPESHSLIKCMEWAEAQGALDHWVRDLIAVGARPPKLDYEIWDSVPRRLAYLQWCSGTSDRAQAAGVLARLLEDQGPVQVALTCRRWQGRGLLEEFEALVRSPAFTQDPGQVGDLEPVRTQFLLLMGLAGATERRAAWTRWEGRGTEISGAQLNELACLVADPPPLGERARAALLDVAREGAARAEDLGAATLIAGRVLVWAGFGPEAENLRDDIHRLVTRSGADLSAILFSRDWPAGSAPPLRLLWTHDRHLEIEGP